MKLLGQVTHDYYLWNVLICTTRAFFQHYLCSTMSSSWTRTTLTIYVSINQLSQPLKSVWLQKIPWAHLSCKSIPDWLLCWVSRPGTPSSRQHLRQAVKSLFLVRYCSSLSFVSFTYIWVKFKSSDPSRQVTLKFSECFIPEFYFFLW